MKWADVSKTIKKFSDLELGDIVISDRRGFMYEVTDKNNATLTAKDSSGRNMSYPLKDQFDCLGPVLRKKVK